MHKRHLHKALVLLVAVATSGAHGGTNFTDAKVERLLEQSLGRNAEASYWFPDSREPAQAADALGVVYVPIQGSAGNVDIKVGYFARSGKTFKLVGRVRDLFGQDPRDARFLPDRIELTTTMPKPGDPRCCPTGMAQWSIDRKSLIATRKR